MWLRQYVVMLGIWDLTSRGDELLLYRPNTVLANRWDDGADFRDLVIGRDITEAPETATFEDVASRIVVRGKDGLEVTETNPRSEERRVGKDGRARRSTASQ